MTGSKKVTIQDIIEEGKKPIQLNLEGIGYLDYIPPNGNEVSELELVANKEIVILRERHKVEYPSVPVDEILMTQNKGRILSDLILWKGLNKVDNTTTMEMLKQIPNDVKSRLSLTIISMQMKGIDSDEMEQIKNLAKRTMV